MSHLVSIITAADPLTRDQSLDAFCRSADVPTLVEECAALDRFRRERGNLYERVRALFFLYAIHRFHLASRPGVRNRGLVPFDQAAVEDLIARLDHGRESP